MRLTLLILSFILIPYVSSAARVIEHPSRQYVLLADQEVPGTNHKASELLDENTVPPEVHSFEFIREAGDQSIEAAFRLNQFYFAFGSISLTHEHDCMHHEFSHPICTRQVEFCWTDYESRCGYEWEYICRYINGKRYCRYEEVYRCRQYPIRRCIWRDEPLSYFETHTHQGNLPHFDSQQSYGVRVVFPSNAPLSGNRTEKFTVEFNGNTPTIRFDNVAYFYFIDKVEQAPAGVTFWLSATSREELSRPSNVSLSLNYNTPDWSWRVEDLIYGIGGVTTSYHLVVQSCFLLFCDKVVDHNVTSPFELFTHPLNNTKTWSIQLDIERSGKFLPTPIRFYHRYEYKNGVFREIS